ncbi:LETM1 domain-containing protein LETM2, mitochondrial [Lingula anatina]|uniref:Mitochondrial proton/calcium exchanger protein n=1 Tax=Lingula anatina TaxID=7574 RepID=A0A1S3J379_LINAN|nr:LETM1 domain-containing protein LETM2, mitochondrial [Lingula anatina]XP_013404858.1 LETM1 domain-containing protein LETM2, mitochondrial [Lingula anatina]XP_013404865.1 LETM1 domain-containing protein LETM2, mitochondrial [Lingula anatina]|eukprot:XP_013404850.1 LETM1 domain-containing protein LETM2, mitochondrial [Lingula anatina]
MSATRRMHSLARQLHHHHHWKSRYARNAIYSQVLPSHYILSANLNYIVSLPHTRNYSVHSTHASRTYFQTRFGRLELSANPSVTFHRPFHRSVCLHKDESKVEKTVKSLKKQPATKQGSSVAVPKKSLWTRFVDVLKHYYHGFKLLMYDVRICSRLVWRIMNGKSLTRRERRQLVRTSSDLFRMVPFLVFIIVPFMEFFLPVALKLFPNMLPSTFEEEDKKQEKMRKKLKVKLEMAKFLQDTIEETALTKKKSTGETLHKFQQFIKKIRNSEEMATNEEIKTFSKLFEDEITLDNLPRGQLIALCKLLELPAVGTNNVLRFQLSMRLRYLKADDKLIEKEGVDSLTVPELQSACRSRGMKAIGISEKRLQSQLRQWLDLHLHDEIPSSLLLLSRALYLPSDKAETGIQDSIGRLPQSIAEDAKIKLAEMEGEQVDNRTKLELIMQEEEALKKEEAERLAAEKEAVKTAVKEEPSKPLEMDLDSVQKMQELAMEGETHAEEDIHLEKAKHREEQEIPGEYLEHLEAALEDIVEEKKKIVAYEKEELETLRKDVSEYAEDLEDLRDIVVATGGQETDYSESKSSRRLRKKVDQIITGMDDILEKLHKEKQEQLIDLEVKEVTMKRSEEIQHDEEKREALQESITEKKENIIDINELMLAIRRLQKIPDDTKMQQIEQIAHELDENNDGRIEVEHVLKVLELIGQENVKLNSAQMKDIISLVKNEHVLEEEERQKEIDEKQQKKRSEAI